MKDFLHVSELFMLIQPFACYLQIQNLPKGKQASIGLVQLDPTCCSPRSSGAKTEKIMYFDFVSSTANLEVQIRSHQFLADMSSKV